MKVGALERGLVSAVTATGIGGRPVRNDTKYGDRFCCGPISKAGRGPGRVKTAVEMGRYDQIFYKFRISSRLPSVPKGLEPGVMPSELNILAYVSASGCPLLSPFLASSAQQWPTVRQIQTVLHTLLPLVT